jgi:thiamine-phosphate pyrophosphorylase
MEEYARLVLDDAMLTTEIKESRHSLAAAVLHLQQGSHGQLSASAVDSSDELFLIHRDILRDVGCEISTSSEYERADESEVAAVAGKRLSEALRVIEEYGKTLDRDFSAAIERLRYRGYEIERRLALTIRARVRFSKVRLYVLLTEALCCADWYATAEAALEGGAQCLQLREKDLTDRELLERAKRLADLCREHDALFIVNDRPDIAVLSNAHGVHLGQDDLSVSDARRTLCSNMLVGVSTHTPKQLAEAADAVPDYIAVGPMFATPTKPQDHIAGPRALAAARESTSLPLVAVGGIDPGNAREVLSAADCCLCVCRSVISTPDVAASAARLQTVANCAQDAGNSGGCS